MPTTVTFASIASDDEDEEESDGDDGQNGDDDDGGRDHVTVITVRSVAQASHHWGTA